MAKKKVYVKRSIAVFLAVFFAVGVFLCVLHIKSADSPSWYRFEKNLYAATKYYYQNFVPSKGWIEINYLDEAWRYFKNEKVGKIVFCGTDYYNLSPDNWWTWGEINEPDRINTTLRLIYDARIKTPLKVICDGRMKIITDKHKFILPVDWDDKEVYSYQWRSSKLREELRKWGFPEFKFLAEPKDANKPREAQSSTGGL